MQTFGFCPDILRHRRLGDGSAFFRCASVLAVRRRRGYWHCAPRLQKPMLSLRHQSIKSRLNATTPAKPSLLWLLVFAGDDAELPPPLEKCHTEHAPVQQA